MWSRGGGQDICKDIIHVARWVRNDLRTIYNVAYRDGKNGTTYIKRSNVPTAIRDREYDLDGKKGNLKSHFSANPNGSGSGKSGTSVRRIRENERN